MGNKEELDRIINQVRKLLAMAQGRANEHEAAVAAEKAASLLTKYNLEWADVETKDADHFVIDSDMVTNSYTWRRPIGTSLAELYFCKYVFHHRYPPGVKDYNPNTRQDVHSFIGAPHNVIMCKEMFVYLIATIERLVKEGAEKQPARERTRYRTSFLHNCSFRLASRLDAKRREAQQENQASGGNLPALYRDTDSLLQEWMRSQFGSLRTRNLKHRGSHARGLADGAEAGARIGLDDQVTSGGGGNHLLPNKR